MTWSLMLHVGIAPRRDHAATLPLLKYSWAKTHVQQLCDYIYQHLSMYITSQDPPLDVGAALGSFVVEILIACM